MADNSEDNKDKRDGSHNPSRRRFLKGVGIAGAGAAIADKLWAEAEAKEEQAALGSRRGHGLRSVEVALARLGITTQHKKGRARPGPESTCSGAARPGRRTHSQLCASFVP